MNSKIGRWGFKISPFEFYFEKVQPRGDFSTDRHQEYPELFCIGFHWFFLIPGLGSGFQTPWIFCFFCKAGKPDSDKPGDHIQMGLSDKGFLKMSRSSLSVDHHQSLALVVRIRQIQ